MNISNNKFEIFERPWGSDFYKQPQKNRNMYM